VIKTSTGRIFPFIFVFFSWFRHLGKRYLQTDVYILAKDQIFIVICIRENWLGLICQTTGGLGSE
jgi:hypothetical protein